MRGLLLAWLAGLGLMSWRDVQEYHRPPVPGRLLGASLVFAALGVIAEYEPARTPAAIAAWGFDLAILFQVGPQALVSTKGFTTNSGSPLATTGGGPDAAEQVGARAAGAATNAAGK